MCVTQIPKNTYKVCREAFPDHNPDWRKPYTYASKLSDHAIAFEFLRRNRDYWKSWAQIFGLSSDPLEWPAEETSPVRFPGAPNAFERFGVWRFSDPRLPLPDWLVPWTRSASLTARYQYAVARADSERTLDYTFKDAPANTIRLDLLADGPVEAQIEFARWALNRVRHTLRLDHKQAPRFSRSLFPRYLRLLDARCDGASYAEIATELFGRRTGSADRLRKEYSIAARLRDGDYRKLLLWGRIDLPAFMDVMPVDEHEDTPDF